MRRAALTTAALLGALAAPAAWAQVQKTQAQPPQEQQSQRALTEVERQLEASRKRDAELARSSEALERELTALRALTQAGLLPRHLLTTGLEFIYEGITIATIQPNQTLTPLIYGSAGNLVTAVYDRNGKRAILDGGFTRLFLKWDTAGTGRYVKNAAAWLVNVERFGDAVVASQLRKEDAKSPK